MKGKYKILNPKFFIKHMEVLGTFLYEGVIRFYKDMIRVVGLYPSRISVMELKMGDDYIETNNKIPLEATIDVTNFAKILKRFSNPEELEIICDEQDNMIIIKGKIRNKIKTFKLSMIDLDTSDWKDPIPNLSKIKYNAIFNLNAKDLHEAILDAELFTEFFTIKTEDQKLHIVGSGATGDSDTLIELETEIYSNEKTDYSIERMKKMLKPMGESNILIMFKSDYPIAIYEKLSNKSHMLYYLAPRVNEDENNE